MKAILNFKFIVIIISIIMIACEKENNSSEKGLNGKWYLMSFECCDLPRETFNRGDIKWEIDTVSEQISVSNKITFDNYSFKENGMYDIQINYNEQILKIINPDKEWDYNFDYLLDNDTLTIGISPESDGPKYIFNK